LGLTDGSPNVNAGTALRVTDDALENCTKTIAVAVPSSARRFANGAVPDGVVTDSASTSVADEFAMGNVPPTWIPEVLNAGSATVADVDDVTLKAAGAGVGNVGEYGIGAGGAPPHATTMIDVTHNAAIAA
jgi:hypothetical protein